MRLAFVAALQHLPPRQRAVLILCEVLRWKASEAAELLDTSVASVNSALQRARATIESSELSSTDIEPSQIDEPDRDLLARYVEAFEAYDMDALTSLIREDAIQSMPPYDLWMSGRDDVLAWWFGPGSPARTPSSSRPSWPTARSRSGSTSRATPAAAMTRGRCRSIDFVDGKAAEFTFFLGTERIFPAVRAAAAAGLTLPGDGSLRQHVVEPHELDQLAERGEGRAADLAAVPEAASCSRASASTATASGRCRRRRRRRPRVALVEQPADPIAEPGRSARAIGPRIAERDRRGDARLFSKQTAGAPKTHRHVRLTNSICLVQLIADLLSAERSSADRDGWLVTMGASLRVDLHQHVWTTPLLDALARRDRCPFVRRTGGLTVLHAGGELPYVIDIDRRSPRTGAPQLLDGRRRSSAR